MDFFTRGGPGEAGGVGEEEGMSEADSATVSRRLAVGGVLTAGLGALALIPSEDVELPASLPLVGGPEGGAPLFLSLVPLLRARGQLDYLEPLLRQGDVDEARSALGGVLGEPLQLQRNLEAAARALEAGSASRERARRLIPDILEYTRGVDFDTYFDTRATRPSGAELAKFTDYSLQSLRKAGGELDAFLALMPKEQLEAARSQVTAFDTRFVPPAGGAQEAEQPPPGPPPEPSAGTGTGTGTGGGAGGGVGGGEGAEAEEASAGVDSAAPGGPSPPGDAEAHQGVRPPPLQGEGSRSAT